ncbi:MAG: hypothetical protein GY874_16295, partial [Desulfobacteraceae bacterium]|nr:hypothetical protein [Desulfobacteraceae bacterium]
MNLQVRTENATGAQCALEKKTDFKYPIVFIGFEYLEKLSVTVKSGRTIPKIWSWNYECPRICQIIVRHRINPVFQTPRMSSQWYWPLYDVEQWLTTSIQIWYLYVGIVQYGGYELYTLMPVE